MGISCLVSTGKHEVLDRFGFEIANIWLDVLGEIKEQENQKEDDRCVPSIDALSPSLDRLTICPCSGLSLFWDKSFEELHKNVDQTLEYERRREVSLFWHMAVCRHRNRRRDLTPEFLSDLQQRSRPDGQAHDVYQADVGQGSGRLRPPEFQ